MYTVVRILVIEDEPKTADAIRKGLQAEGYEATVALTGRRMIQIEGVLLSFVYITYIVLAVLMR